MIPDQWLRANVRAALIESGYDAVGARTVREAVGRCVDEPGRGPVRAIILDQSALPDSSEGEADTLRQRCAEAAAILIAPGHRAPAKGEWDEVVRRPVTIGALVRVVRTLVPLPHGPVGPGEHGSSGPS